MKKIFLNLALTCVALASFQAIAQTPDTEKKTVISEKVTKKSKVRISHTGYSETAKAKTLEKFKAVLESSNVGNVELFDGSAAKYKDTSELDSVELGVIEVNAPISGLISSINRETSLDILTLPYLFNDYSDIEKFIKSPIANNILSDLNKKNKYSEYLAFLPGEPKVIVGPTLIKNINDMKGNGVLLEAKNNTLSKTFLAMGVPEDQIFTFAVTDLNKAINGESGYNAKFVSVSLNELNNPNLKNSKFKVSFNNYGYVFNVLTVNKRWFNSLPEDVKNNIRKSSAELAMFHINYAKESVEKTKENFKKNNIEYYEWKNEDIKQLKQKIIPLHEEYLKTSTKNYLSETYITLQAK